MYLYFWWFDRIECANKRDANAFNVVIERMSTDEIPASANVCEAIASDEEVISDIRPFSRFDVESLSKSHMHCTFRLRLAEFRGGVTDNYIWYW